MFKLFRQFDLFRTPPPGGEPSIPAPALALPLQGSLLPSTGTGTLTHTRATSAWMWRDSDGRMWRDYAAGRVLIECPAGELRFEGARRVRNLLPNSSMAGAVVGVIGSGGAFPTGWTIGACAGITREVLSIDRAISTITFRIYGTSTDSVTRFIEPSFCATTSVALSTGQTAASYFLYRVVSGSVSSGLQSAASVRLKGQAQNGSYLTVAPSIIAPSESRQSIVWNISTANVVFVVPYISMPVVVGGVVDITIEIQAPQLFDVTGLTNTGESEYLPTSYLTYPYHGAGADGVKYYSTLANGTPIPASEISAVVEPQATNLLLNSATLSTQNVTVTAQPYTLSFRGTGSVTLSGAATGTLAGTGEHNRVQLTFTPTAGTLTLTVTGSVTTAVLRTGTIAGTYIPTAGSTVTRNADALALTNYTLSNTLGTLYFEASAADWAQVAGQLFGDGAEYLLAPITTNSGIRAFDGTNLALGPTGTPSGVMKFAVRWNATTGKMRLAANGVLGDEANYDGDWNLGSQLLAPEFAGLIRNFRAYSTALTDAQMRRLTQ